MAVNDPGQALPYAAADHGEGADVEFVSLLLRASARIEHTLNVVLVDWGLNLVQYRLLGAIVRDGISAPGRCARQLGVTPSNITRAVDQLHAKNLVHRFRGTDDRRAVTLYATAAGIELLDHARKRVDASLAENVPRTDGAARRLLTAAMTQMTTDDDLSRFGKLTYP